ncbi:MAG TPA: iron ABC transporter permease, partial [Candidatus Methylomirabilis sp.]|nr:iron ABC transporter permease [Candidatus Methylomirabilis sp.]
PLAHAQRLRSYRDLGLVLPVGILVLGPIGFLAWMGLAQGLGDVLPRARELDILATVARVFVLATTTTFLAAIMGVPLAWLTVRSDLPGRQFIRWLAALPLAIPPYIGAIVYQILFAPRGPVNMALARTLGLSPGSQVVGIYGVAGAAWVLSLFVFPYIFLLAAAGLERMNPAFEEVARATGMSRLAVFFKVTLPMLRPALVAGGLMVFLYAWADFGVVSLLRVRTLTTIVYDYVQGTMDWAIPSSLSIFLTLITLAVLAIQLRILGHGAYAQVVGSVRPSPPVTVGRWRVPAMVFGFIVLLCALGVPVGVLVYQTSHLTPGVAWPFLSRQVPYIANSLLTAAAGASVAILLALVIGWLQARRRLGRGASTLFQIGYAIPGTVLGLGMVGFFQAAVPWLYGSPAVLVAGYLVLFVMPALQGVSAALEQVSSSLEDAARGLGRGALATFWEVTLPLVRPGLVGAWVLVFILCMRELAATLILRPPGFDTLPVRIWIHTMDVGPVPTAALLALVLVGMVALPWLGLVLLGRRGIPIRW